MLSHQSIVFNVYHLHLICCVIYCYASHGDATNERREGGREGGEEEEKIPKKDRFFIMIIIPV